MNRVSGDYGTEFAGDQHIAFSPAKFMEVCYGHQNLRLRLSRCLRLELLVGQVLAELGIKANIRRVEDPRQINRYVLAGPPGLVINGELVSEGKLPTREEVRSWITAALSWESGRGRREGNSRDGGDPVAAAGLQARRKAC